jgi:hypothetical protein
LTQQLAWMPARSNFNGATDATTTYVGGVLTVSIDYPTSKLNAVIPFLVLPGIGQVPDLPATLTASRACNFDLRRPSVRALAQPPSASGGPASAGCTGVGLHLHLDTEGRVLHLTGPLRHVLAQQVPHARAPHLLDFAPALRLVVEGSAADWQGRPWTWTSAHSVVRPCTCAAGSSLWPMAGCCS